MLSGSSFLWSFLPALTVIAVPVHSKFPMNYPGNHYNFRRVNFPALYATLSDIDWSLPHDVEHVDAACDLFILPIQYSTLGPKASI